VVQNVGEKPDWRVNQWDFWQYISQIGFYFNL